MYIFFTREDFCFTPTQDMAGMRRKVRGECVKVVRLLCDVFGKRRCFLNYRVSPVLYWCFVCVFLLNRFAHLWVNAGGYWILRNREGPRILTYIHTNIVHWSTHAYISHPRTSHTHIQPRMHAWAYSLPRRRSFSGLEFLLCASI